MNKIQVSNSLKVNIEGIEFNYGVIPSTIINNAKGWSSEIVYYIESDNLYDTEKYELLVNKLIDKLQSQSYDHGYRWVKNNICCEEWTENYQLTIVGFDTKDIF